MRGKDKRQDWVYVGVATVCRRLFKSNPTLLFIEFMPFYELSKWKMFHAKRPVTRRLIEKYFTPTVLFQDGQVSILLTVCFLLARVVTAN